MTYYSLLIDKEQAAVSHWIAFKGKLAVDHLVFASQYAKIDGDDLGAVGHNRVGYAFYPTLIALGIEPGKVAILCVCRAGYNYCVTLIEFRKGFLECDQLCRTYESEIHRVEEEDNILLAYIL